MTVEKNNRVAKRKKFKENKQKEKNKQTKKQITKPKTISSFIPKRHFISSVIKTSSALLYSRKKIKYLKLNHFLI